MDRRKPRSRATRILGAFAVTAIVATTVGAATLLSDDSGEDTPEPEEVELEGEALELADLLEQREGEVYHASYEGVGPEGAVLQVESWQEGPNTRQDQRITNEGDTITLSTFVLTSGRVSCLLLEGQEWTCRRSAAGEQASVDPLETIRARIGEGTVTASDENVEGRQVRCYEFVVEDQDNELCLIPERGIPVRIRGGSTELLLVALEDDVAEGSFTLPAEIAA